MTKDLKEIYPKIAEDLYNLLFNDVIDHIVRHYRCLMKTVDNEHRIEIDMNPEVHQNIYQFDSLVTLPTDIILDRLQDHNAWESVDDLYDYLNDPNNDAYVKMREALNKNVLSSLTEQERNDISVLIENFNNNGGDAYIMMSPYNEDHDKYILLKKELSKRILKVFSTGYYNLLLDLDIIDNMITGERLPIYSDNIAYSVKKWEEVKKLLNDIEI